MKPDCATAGTYAFPLTVTSELPRHLGRIPMSVRIDFGATISRDGLPGVPDPNSIELIDLADGETVPLARAEDFAYGDAGRIEWSIGDSDRREYEVRFRTAEARPALLPQDYVPMVGVGDLLRYNAGVPRPIAAFYSMGLIDMTGDGRADLVGCWNYYHRPGSPISGIACYPRVGAEADFTFGDLVRLRYVTEPDSEEYHHFPGTYIQADFADLNGDGAMDLVVNGHFIRNTNPEGWPFEAAEPVDLRVGKFLTFMDLSGDGGLDVIGLPAEGLDATLGTGNRAVWRRSMGGDRPAFGEPTPLDSVDVEATMVSAATDGPDRGILVQHNMYQEISFYRLAGQADDQPVFPRRSRASSISAPLSCSDQAWPCMVDWDGDGVTDLVIGGGYGWPRVVMNSGTNERPAWEEPHPIRAGGKPIRIRRNDTLHGKHWHNMGYSYPVFVDWDGDGLMDLVYTCSGTGKTYLLRNVGTKAEPVFDLPREFRCYGEGIAFTVHGPHVWPGDLNGDGKPDLLGCVEWSVYPFYAYAALEMDAHPKCEIGMVKR